MAETAKIRCRGLWKIYGPNVPALLARGLDAISPELLAATRSVAAVRDVSFEVQSGEILVIMGLSGSGKSTLVRCLSRLVEPSAGEVWFDALDVTRASEREMIQLRRHKMGMVFQNFGLLPHRNVLRNVAFPLEIQGTVRAVREARALSLLNLVGLGQREYNYPRELSGGQQQRVGIARSLAVEPDVWLLDEPFSALDPLIRREMQDEFLRLQRLLHKTIVFITHDFDEAIRVADRIGIMKEGAIIQLGTPEQLVTAPATDYVRKFTRSAPKAKLISAMAAMDPLPAGSDGPAAKVSASAKLEQIAPMVLEGEGPVGVVNSDGRTIGLLTRAKLIGILFGEAGTDGR